MYTATAVKVLKGKRVAPIMFSKTGRRIMAYFACFRKRCLLRRKLASNYGILFAQWASGHLPLLKSLLAAD